MRAQTDRVTAPEAQMDPMQQAQSSLAGRFARRAHSRSAGLAGRRRVQDSVAAWAIIAALLIQTLYTAPLALRMAATDLGATLAAFPLCASGGGTGDRPAPGDAPCEDHDHCLLCQGGLHPFPGVPPITAMAALAAVPVVFTEAAIHATRPTPPSAYSSRGPPAENSI